ncbi:MAG: alkaline phosphatase family protein [Candidatus Eisenbacteria sp.]|nr:alkaline phosphatase family protein [Candidatus Eisenbacteria bacterium]
MGRDWLTGYPWRGAGRIAALVALAALLPGSAQAYVGPGAGFAVVGSLAVVLVTFILAFIAILTWPFRAVWRAIRIRHLRRSTDTKRVIILGLDGLDPVLLRRWMDDGQLPNFKRLAEQGTFRSLASSVPPISPVAWSTFATGVDASRHNIFDFLNRDLKSYLPVLSSTDIRQPVRTLKVGRYEFPISKPMVRLLRKSKPFWQILGEHYVPCHVLRIPITFPPEQVSNGVLLSAMCVPDLRGTQGSFTFFTTDKERAEAFEGGTVIHVESRGDTIETEIPGPPNPLTRDHEVMKIPLQVCVDRGARKARFTVDGKTHTIGERQYSEWIRLKFKSAFGQKVRGIVRFRVMDFEPHFNLYMSPINLDPESPAMPISSPGFFAQYLSRLNGSYATLGLAEDTWALNERITDEEAFLDYTALIHEEREKMWFNSLKKNRSGLNVIVFDDTDRIQHMFFRYISDPHPANRDKDTKRFENAVFEVYRKADDVVGRTMKYVDDKTVFFAISDHGFVPFKRGINLNSWLMQNGYLAAKNGSVNRYLDGVDWSRTRAYTFGLTGIYINLKGRESRGTVERKGQYAALKKELIAGLSGLRDPETGKVGILRVYDADEIYHGPYRHNGPDLVIGYNRDYRASWNGAVGMANDEVFEDNTKSWSGDHCVDPLEVPGIFFCNRVIKTEFPGLVDFGPTVLDLFGVPRPAYMTGISLFDKEACAKRTSLVDAYFPSGRPAMLATDPPGTSSETTGGEDPGQQDRGEAEPAAPTPSGKPAT